MKLKLEEGAFSQNSCSAGAILISPNYIVRGIHALGAKEQHHHLIPLQLCDQEHSFFQIIRLVHGVILQDTWWQTLKAATTVAMGESASPGFLQFLSDICIWYIGFHYILHSLSTVALSMSVFTIVLAFYS